MNGLWSLRRDIVLCKLKGIPHCVCHFYSPVGVMFLGTRGLHEFTQPCLLSDFCKHFSHLFYNQNDLKTKFKVIRYFLDFQSLKQCLISNLYNIGLLQSLKNYHFSGENKNIFQWRVNSVVQWHIWACKQSQEITSQSQQLPSIRKDQAGLLSRAGEVDWEGGWVKKVNKLRSTN